MTHSAVSAGAFIGSDLTANEDARENQHTDDYMLVYTIQYSSPESKRGSLSQTIPSCINIYLDRYVCKSLKSNLTHACLAGGHLNSRRGKDGLHSEL